MVGRQIARMSLGEAKVQMQFSHKKAARKVLATLELVEQKGLRLGLPVDRMRIGMRGTGGCAHRPCTARARG